MDNASFDRSDPRDTTRGGVSLAPHAKTSMGGAGMRNTKVRGAVDCLCERCLLITESPKTPGHFRYLIWVLCYIPYTGLAVFSCAISRVPVYTAVSKPCEFVFSTL